MMRVVFNFLYLYQYRCVDVSGYDVSMYQCTIVFREVVYMERPIEPNMGPSLADVLLCTFESTNAGFSSFPVRKLLS